MDSIRDELRFARRMFARRRRFACLLVATVAVGIGSATSIFSLVDVAGALWWKLQHAGSLGWTSCES